jgi:hypothetical protein
VYRNGVKLALADFTATNGTTVVLANPATAGDVIETDSFYVSSVVNAIPATAGAVNSTYLAAGAVQQTNLAAGVAGNGPAFRVVLNNNQSFTSAVSTKVVFDTKTFDTNNNVSSGTFTPTVAGYYQINAGIYFTLSTGSFTNARIQIYKNGSLYSRGTMIFFSGTDIAISTSDLVYCNGSTDYIEIYGYAGGTTTGQVFVGSLTNTYFTGAMVRSQ